MGSTVEQVLDAALALSAGDRVELMESLLASFQPDDRPPLDESWRAIVQRRSEELKLGQATLIPWEVVKKNAREKAGG